MTSKLHGQVSQLLRKMDSKAITENIYFRPIAQADMDEIKDLHKEWFPLNYPDSFYKKILTNNNVIAIGCFIKVDSS